MCAPTGAGKTNVAMLAILHTMSLYRNAETGKIDTSKFKIVYVAPMKVHSGPSMLLLIRIESPPVTVQSAPEQRKKWSSLTAE